MSEETWKPVTGYEGIYEVSDLGRLKRLSNGNITYGHKKKDGYIGIKLYKEHSYKCFLVHVLVAREFLPNPKYKKYVDHTNCIRSDNRASNLRWVTAKENANNPITLQRHRDKKKTPMSENAKRMLSIKRKGENNPFYGKKHSELFIERISEPIVQISCDGKLVRQWISASEASRKLGICREAINRCCRGLSNTSFGYKWYYKDDYDNRYSAAEE